MKSYQLWFAFLCLVVSSCSYADDGWWSAAGGIESFGKSHPTIRMASEDLRITLHDGEAADVDVSFVFVNDGPATSVTMGFPEDYEMRTEGSLDHFRTWVDGHRVAARRKVLVKGDKSDLDNTGKAVWLKQVRFGAHQRRVVRVTYHGWYAGNTAGDLALQYTLKSGASWKGPIGECKITVDSTHLRKLSAPYLELSGADWRLARRRVTTATLKNWEPDDDLLVRMIPGFWNFTVNGEPIEPEDGRGYYGKPYVVGSKRDPLLRAEAFDRFFGGWVTKGDDEDWTDWKNPVCQKFGAFNISKGKLTLFTGKVKSLRRGYKMVRNPSGDHSAEFVYLKDVVEALGGRFRYVEGQDLVDLRF